MYWRVERLRLGRGGFETRPDVVQPNSDPKRHPSFLRRQESRESDRARIQPYRSNLAYPSFQRFRSTQCRISIAHAVPVSSRIEGIPSSPVAQRTPLTMALPTHTTTAAPNLQHVRLARFRARGNGEYRVSVTHGVRRTYRKRQAIVRDGRELVRLFLRKTSR